MRNLMVVSYLSVYNDGHDSGSSHIAQQCCRLSIGPTEIHHLQKVHLSDQAAGSSVPLNKHGTFKLNTNCVNMDIATLQYD